MFHQSEQFILSKKEQFDERYDVEQKKSTASTLYRETGVSGEALLQNKPQFQPRSQDSIRHRGLATVGQVVGAKQPVYEQSIEDHEGCLQQKTDHPVTDI